MNTQFPDGVFNQSGMINIPNISMLDLSAFNNPAGTPKKVKKKKEAEKLKKTQAYVRGRPQDIQ